MDQHEFHPKSLLLQAQHLIRTGVPSPGNGRALVSADNGTPQILGGCQIKLGVRVATLRTTCGENCEFPWGLPLHVWRVMTSNEVVLSDAGDPARLNCELMWPARIPSYEFVATSCWKSAMPSPIDLHACAC